MHLGLLSLAASAALAAAPSLATEPPAAGSHASVRDDPGAEPPSRALHRELTASARLAGTSGGLWGARAVARRMQEAGCEVEIESFDVVLSLPRRLGLELFADGTRREPFHSQRRRFDPDAIPAGDLPPFNSWSKSGAVRAPVLDVGFGLRADYEALLAAGVDPRGTIALARYGRSYRGVKVTLAEEFGCVGVLLTAEPVGPDEEGTPRAPWPQGPWRPDWEVERGSIKDLAEAPGDPSTPGWPSPRRGLEGRRLEGPELDALLPSIPCLPIPWEVARELLPRLERRSAGEAGLERAVGPGPVEARLDLDVRREVRAIHNVIARIPGRRPEQVIVGNHRDAWVRGGQDAATGTVVLIRAAQRLGERAREGWRPRYSIVFAFWDAEETGLIGSTEWGESHAKRLVDQGLCYINADVAVSGTRLTGMGGTPGLMRLVEEVTRRVPAVDAEPGWSLFDQWSAAAGPAGPRLGLLGSGSDYTVFLHHLGLPVLDLGLGGNAGGLYHTALDDHTFVDRFLDPTWMGHETAAHLVAELLLDVGERGPACFEEDEAARRMGQLAVAEADWLGAERAERIERAFERLAQACEARGGSAPLGEARFYRALFAPEGLAGRAWFRNELWAPGLETGYSAETLPTLRLAARRGEAELERATVELVERIEALARARRP